MQVIEKVWGKEEILKQDNNYMVKRLTMNAYQRCSLQYHEHKQETIYVLQGPLFVYLQDNRLVLNSGDYLTIEPHQQHRMEAGSWSAVYLEASTNHPNDVVRIADDYGRKTVG